MPETVRSYRELKVWIAAEDVFDMVCADCVAFSKNNQIGWMIRDQVLRSSGSIGANIAEGFSRQTKQEFIQFLNIARGSLAETEVWIARMSKQHLISPEREVSYQPRLIETGKMLNGLIRALHRAPAKPPHTN